MNMMTKLFEPTIAETVDASIVEAFLMAFDEWRQMDDTGDPDSVRYQSALNAYEGAKARAISFRPSREPIAGLALILAWEELDCIKGGIYRVANTPVDRDEWAGLTRSQGVIQELWRLLDRGGHLSQLRRYAEYVGIADNNDKDRWTSQRASAGEVPRTFAGSLPE